MCTTTNSPLTQLATLAADALSLEVLEMRDLRSCMKDSDFKRGFRYFCNEETNLENLLFFEQVEDFRKKAEKLARKVRSCNDEAQRG